MKKKWKLAYMDVAERFAQESYDTRLKVGAIVVKQNSIISIGINGMPSGWENVCEDRIYLKDHPETHGDIDDIQVEYPHEDEYGKYKLKSKVGVLHAERNALDKLARSNRSGEGSTIFITHSPCIECAKSIYGAGISRVYYKHKYKSDQGIKFLQQCNIKITQIKN